MRPLSFYTWFLGVSSLQPFMQTIKGGVKRLAKVEWPPQCACCPIVWYLPKILRLTPWLLGLFFKSDYIDSKRHGSSKIRRSLKAATRGNGGWRGMRSSASHAPITTCVTHESLGDSWEGSHVIKFVRLVIDDHLNLYTGDQYWTRRCEHLCLNKHPNILHDNIFKLCNTRHWSAKPTFKDPQGKLWKFHSIYYTTQCGFLSVAPLNTTCPMWLSKGISTFLFFKLLGSFWVN